MLLIMNAIMIVALKSQSERYIPSTVQQDKLYLVIQIRN